MQPACCKLNVSTRAAATYLAPNFSTRLSGSARPIDRDGKTRAER